jgi:hypothetical protein
MDKSTARDWHLSQLGQGPVAEHGVAFLHYLPFTSLVADRHHYHNG